MKIKLGIAGMSLLALVACDEGKKPEAGETDKPTVANTAKSDDAKKEDTEPAKTNPKKLDSDGLEAVADAVKFEQGEKSDKSFKGKLENTSEHGISLLEYKAFAYGPDGKLIEMIAGKFSKALDAGASAEIEVGPFDKAAAQDDVTVEVVVSWMNVGGTSYQRPVPKDRPKGGPNNALKK